MGKKIIYCNINGLYLLEKVLKRGDLRLLLRGNVPILRRVKDERVASAYRVSIAKGLSGSQYQQNIKSNSL